MASSPYTPHGEIVGGWISLYEFESLPDRDGFWKGALCQFPQNADCSLVCEIFNDAAASLEIRPKCPHF